MNARELRSALSILGMSYRELAARAHVNERSVKRWCDGSAPWDVPDGVTLGIIVPELERQDAAVETCLRIVEKLESEYGEPRAVRLPWYLSADELREHCQDERTVDMANADTTRCRAALEALGYAVEIVAPDETGAVA